MPHLPPVLSGPDNAVWKGDQVGYTALHERVRRARGPARDHSCIDCHQPASEWSYDHLDPNGQVSAEGFPFSVKIEHYEPRCSSCHYRFDGRSKGVA